MTTDEIREVTAIKVMGWVAVYAIDGTRVWAKPEEGVQPADYMHVMDCYDWEPNINLLQAMMCFDAMPIPKHGFISRIERLRFGGYDVSIRKVDEDGTANAPANDKELLPLIICQVCIEASI